MIYNEYLQSVLLRLEGLSFISGEAGLKADSLHRLCGIITHYPEAIEDEMQILATLRVYVLDWDRNVRASAFRGLRYLFSRSMEQTYTDKNLHVLLMIRLESSKSSIERSEILRLVCLWLREGENDTVRRFLCTSLVALLVGQITAGVAKGQSSPSPFTETVQSMVLSICSTVGRHDNEYQLTIDLSLMVLHGCFSLFPLPVQRQFLNALLHCLDSRKQVVTIPHSCLSVETVEHLLRSHAGIHLLANSIEPDSVLHGSDRDEYINLLYWAFETNPDDFLPQLLYLSDSISLPVLLLQMLRDDVVRHSVSSRMVELLRWLGPAEYLQELCESDAWRFPEWVNQAVRELVHEDVRGAHIMVRRRSSSPGEYSPFLKRMDYSLPILPEFTPESSTSAECSFTPAHLEVLQLISGLASGVQFKVKCNALTGMKQKSPYLFQSVPLFVQVHLRVGIGRFSLQARRVIHGLFVHTLCDFRSLEKW